MAQATGLPAVMQALSQAGKPVGRTGTNPFPPLAGIPAQQAFLSGGGEGDLMPLLMELLATRIFGGQSQ